MQHLPELQQGKQSKSTRESERRISAPYVYLESMYRIFFRYLHYSSIAVRIPNKEKGDVKGVGKLYERTVRSRTMYRDTLVYSETRLRVRSTILRAQYASRKVRC